LADGDVVRRITISATGEGIDSTTQSTQALASSVSDLTDKSSAWGNQMGILSTVLTGGVVAGLAGLLDYVVKANKELAGMDTTAHQVGLTLEAFQGIQFGGAIKGLSTDQINSGLERSASLLNDASRNSNSLSKELDANGISLKNSNGQLISENQLLGVAAELVRKAKNPGDQLAIAQMLGFTKEWIPLLEKGSSAIAGLADEAKNAGAMIDDETIKKATEFDDKWRKSSVEFQSYMKAAIADMLPAIDDVIERAAKLIQEVKKKGADLPGSIAKVAADNALSGVGVDPGKGILIDQDGLRGLREFQNSPIFSTDTWVNLGRALSSGIHFNVTPEMAAQNVPGFAASQITEPSYPTAKQMDAAFDKANPPDPGSRAHPADGLTSSDYENASPSKVASKDVANDAVDRAINSLRRHTDQQIADTKAVGLGDAALAGFRAEAAETAAVQANGGKETAAQSAAFAELKTKATEAAGALALAKANNDVSRGRATSLLSPEDVTIANQLKGLYPDVATALNSVQASGLRTNAALSGIASTASSTLTTGLADILDGTKSVSQGFGDMAKSILRSIEEMIIKLLIVGPLMRALQGGLTGGASILGITIPGHAAGTDSSPGGWHMIGEKGPELMNVPRGAQILPNGKMPPGGNTTTIQYNIDAAGADSGTIKRIQDVLNGHAKAITQQSNAMKSAQRMQQSGVG
jgi:hypothetical protein